MWELFLFLILLILPIAFMYSINKYKLFETQKGLDKLYTYSKYLIYTIKDDNVFKKPKYIKLFKRYLKNKENIFYVLHTDSKVIYAEHIDYINDDKKKEEENFNKLIGELKNSIKNKDLTISFYNLKNAKSEETNFFWSIVNYKAFTFIKYVTWSNFAYALSFILGLCLILFTLLSQKTLYILGIPQQLSLMSIFEFAQFILYNNLVNLSTMFTSSTIISVVGLILCLFLCWYVYTIFKKIKIKSLILWFDIFIAIILVIIFVINYFILILHIMLTIVSIIKMDFKDSAFGYDNVVTTAYEYIQYTGYPKVADINGNKSYIVGYDNSSLYYYDLKNVNESFYHFEKKIKKDEKNKDSLLKTCKNISKYKKSEDDKSRTIDNIWLNIIFINNEYLKPKYIKSIAKKDAKIENESLLEYEDIIHKDIKCQCKKYIKKYEQDLDECPN